MAIAATTALERFGLGAKPGERERIAADPSGWLLRQTELRLPKPDLSALRLATVQAGEAARVTPKPARRQALKALFQDIRERQRRTFAATFASQAMSDAPFVERLVWFWTNHFAVSAKGKPRVSPFVATFADDAIRPHVFGRFEDMLVAVEQHPAMLIYLDNALSVGPGSPAGERRNRGLNENLAREILELHTLGVDGGYKQSDVIELAKAITGWTVPFGPGTSADDPPFLFMRARHEPGDKIILGKRYGAGLDEGERALRDIARRPETARFVCRKLCRHFLGDAPEPDHVERLAGVFLETGGDLRETSRALIALADAAAGLSTRKYRTPLDHLAAATRALGPEPFSGDVAFRTLAYFGQAPFLADSPAGYPDRAADWATPDAVARRVEWASRLAARTRIDRDPASLAADLYGDALSVATRTEIAGAESAAQGLALLLVSPEFMWR